MNGDLLIKPYKTFMGKGDGTRLTMCNEGSLPFLNAEAHFLERDTLLNSASFLFVTISLASISTW